MKFYFDGQLIRTSKTHHYTHAVIKRTENDWVLYGCSSSFEGAEKMMMNSIPFKRYRMWASVQDGSYRPKDRYAYNIEQMRKKADEQYGSIENAVKSSKDGIEGFEIVEIEEA